MSRKLILLCAFAALSFTGCHKLHSLFGKKATPTPEPVQAANPPATPPPAPVATPPPASGHVSNRNAAVIALCYHNVGDERTGALNLTIEEFEKEMQELKDNGFSVISMDDFLAWRHGTKTIPAKSALITVDDGWVTAYTNVWPILKKFNYPFTLFIYIDYVNTGGKSMTWDQIEEMRDAGVDIEPHTYSHSDLKIPGHLVDKTTAARVAKDVAALGQDGWLRKEVIGSKEFLENKLGIKARVFAYPYGRYNEKVLELVKEAGYEAAFTTYGQRLAINSPYDRLGRYAIDSKSPQDWKDALKMVGGGAPTGPDSGPDEAQLAGASMITEPASAETIGNPLPMIKANLATMELTDQGAQGELDPATVKMRISGMGPVPAKYDAATKTISYQVTEKLKDTSYSVIISAKTKGGQTLETKWSFNYDATGKHVGPPPAPSLPPQ
ncbi:MAG TPA: polysaccharide deacetylase family protein [Chthoniobacteraceae bacterium]|nr:polysaccharide deacetylase family protein [Chthoniobacteraceae bacterium]